MAIASITLDQNLNWQKHIHEENIIWIESQQVILEIAFINRRQISKLQNRFESNLGL